MGAPRLLMTIFSEVTDPRVERCKRHSLVDILGLVLCAVICGADNLVDIEQFGEAREAQLRQWLELPNGIPSHDTLGRVLSRLCPSELEACFREWVSLVRAGLKKAGLTEAGDSEGGSKQEVTRQEVIALDGKTARRSFDTHAGISALHVVSAYASEARLVLGQVATQEKSNEITAIPKLLELLDIAGCVITIDAMGCQKEIAQRIRSQGGDYVLALKENQASLLDDVRAYFTDAKERGFVDRPVSLHETTDYDHGRVEVRRVYVSDEVEWLLGRDKNGDWKGLKSIVMVESDRTQGKRTAHSRRFYISSLPAEAQRVARAIRAHWTIENQLHWTLDVTFNEDQSRVRKDHAQENLVCIRHIAFDLLQQEKTPKMSMRAKQRKAAWDPDYLPTILAHG